ncbi:MAG: phosphate ABC transporter substrate-binding protein, PhoT family [Lachnospiraceae bacterium]|nr:phosphate ABC transporter substrate-binding protein, PhoT family [Lachnospiraceae bacterium]
MKLVRQITVIIVVALSFILFDMGVYNVITKRCINNTSKEMQAKSIELDKYLPFDEDSLIAALDGEASLKLTENLPVVDGAAAIYPVYSAFVNAVYPKESVSFDGTNFTENSAMQYTNTRGAYKGIVDGDVDVIFCVKPSDEQLKYAEENGVELEFVPIGREAFVFIVNKDNPVDNLSIEQLKGVYSGKYTNWSQVGGDDYIIDALQRNKGSGSQSALESFMGEEEIKKNPLGFMGRAIGFSFRYYVSGIVENGGVKMLSLDGVYPSKENISNGSYPIISDIYAVYRKDDDNQNIPILIDWILSEEGQKLVEDSGYVPAIVG